MITQDMIIEDMIIEEKRRLLVLGCCLNLEELF